MSFRADGKEHIQGGVIFDPDTGAPVRQPDGTTIALSPSLIPEWLARVAYAEYARLYGKDQGFRRLHERGGFGPVELLMLLRGEPDGAQARRDIRDAILGDPP